MAKKYASFRLERRIKPEKRLPNVFKLWAEAVWQLRSHWKAFLGIAAIYGLGVLLLQKGFGVLGSVGDLKNVYATVSGSNGNIGNSFSLFFDLLSNTNNALNPVAGSYQLLFGVVVSLVVIWSLRQAYAGHAVSVRDGFYRGMQPLIPFLLITLVILAELLPMLGGLGLYSTVVMGGLAVNWVEVLLWAVLCSLLVVLSLYLLCSTIFALYVVSLPGMTPMSALRSARELVRHRRWSVMRKLLFLPFSLLIVGLVLIVPFIAFAPALAGILFFIGTVLVLPLANAYMYTLYRSLL